MSYAQAAERGSGERAVFGPSNPRFVREMKEGSSKGQKKPDLQKKLNRLTECLNAASADEIAGVRQGLRKFVPFMVGSNPNLAHIHAAALLFSNVFEKASETEQGWAKEHLQRLLPAPKPPEPVKKEIPVLVTTGFDEKSLESLSKTISSLFERFHALSEAIKSENTQVSGATVNIKPSSTTYPEDKAAANARFTNYPPLYNRGVDLLIELKQNEGSIQRLRDQVQSATAQYSTSIEDLEKRLLKIFKRLGQQHQLLSEGKEGGESYASRWTGQVTVVKVPFLGSKEYYQKPASASPQDAQKNESNFSTLFRELDSYHAEASTFSKQAKDHLKLVAGQRHAFLSNDPEVLYEKALASKYLKDYEALHDRCLSTFEKLESYKIELTKVKGLLISMLENKSKEIQGRRENLLDLAGTLFEQFQALDSKLNDPANKKAAGFKKLTADSLEKLKEDAVKE